MCFVKYITKECFGRSDADSLEAIILLLRTLNGNTFEHVPALAKALINLHGGTSRPPLRIQTPSIDCARRSNQT